MKTSTLDSMFKIDVPCTDFANIPVDLERMTELITNNCQRFGYRAVTFKKYDGPQQVTVDGIGLTKKYINTRLQTLNPNRKCVSTRVLIRLVDLRQGKVNVGLTISLQRLGRLCICCDPVEVITDIDDLKGCN